MKGQYVVIMNEIIYNGSSYTTYGIAYADIADGCAAIIDSISDLSTDRERVSRLAKLCTSLDLQPAQLREVAADFIEA